jgi:ABC transport system ATP-binding/permease protein
MAAATAARLATAKKKLSYKENRELETIEQRVAEAEAELQAKHDALLDPAIMSDGVRLHAVSLELEVAQKRIDGLYARWVELEEKLK